MHSGLLSSQEHESFFVLSLVGEKIKKIEENCEQNSDMNSNIGENAL